MATTRVTSSPSTTLPIGQNVHVRMIPIDPPVIEVAGKRFRITHIQMKTAEVWKDIDLADLDIDKISKHVMELFKKTNTNATSFTLYCERESKGKSIFNGWKGPQVTLRKMEYTTQGVQKTLDFKDYDIQTIQSHLQVLNQEVFEKILSNPNYTKSPEKKKFSEVSPLSSAVQDAKSTDNRRSAFINTQNNLLRNIENKLTQLQVNEDKRLLEISNDIKKTIDFYPEARKEIISIIERLKIPEKLGFTLNDEDVMKARNNEAFACMVLGLEPDIVRIF